VFAELPVKNVPEWLPVNARMEKKAAGQKRISSVKLPHVPSRRVSAYVLNAGTFPVKLQSPALLVMVTAVI